MCVRASSHPLPLDDLDVVLRPGVVALRTQSPPEVTPQLPMKGQHGSDHRPEGRRDIDRKREREGERDGENKSEDILTHSWCQG